MSDFLDAFANAAVPPEQHSRWLCNRVTCDGSPHGPYWDWCGHSDPSHCDQTCRHARSAQHPPDGDWFMWLLLTGRGFGKSRAAAEWLVASALAEPAAEWCVIARNSADVRKNARDMQAGLVKVAGSHLVQYNRHEEDIYLDNGAVIHCVSAEKPDRLRGFNLAGAWADELASWRNLEDTWNYGLIPTLRVGSHPRVVVTTTPKPVPLLKKLYQEAQAESELPPATRSKIITVGSTWDNAANLAPNFIAEMRSSYEGTRVGRQELEGELIFDMTGTLVNPEMIHAARVESIDPEDLIRVVVAVDPAGTYGEDSDETGIVVCAKGRDGHGYVLADKTMKGTPDAWARTAAAAYEIHQADCLIAETNIGNDMVESVVRSVMPTVRYKSVRARVGKRLRAEPITALYEQMRIHHVGTFPKLEDQICSFSLEEDRTRTRGSSPDRMDALVHGFTELGLARFGPGAGFVQFMRNQLDKREADDSVVRLGQHLRSRQDGAARERRRRQISCTHRWRGTSCVFCGAAREAS